MSLPRTKLWLAVWVLAMLAATPAHAQGLRDMQIFAPAEMDHFGDGARADEGAFFQLEGLSWWISPPDNDTIGKAGMQREAYLSPTRAIIQNNSHDLSDLSADPVSGTRLELGYIHEHDGILFSYFNLTSQNQRLTYGASDVVFDDQPIPPYNRGRLEGYVADMVFSGSSGAEQSGEYINIVLRKLPIRFDQLTVTNHAKTWGTELAYVYRSHAGSHAGILELLLGARYLSFDERFSVDGVGDPFLWQEPVGSSSSSSSSSTTTTTGGTSDGTTESTTRSTNSSTHSGIPIGPNTILADSVWWAYAENHIIGPQLGLRWFRQNERWTWESEARFFAGFNIQNLKQGATLGSELAKQNIGGAPEDEEDDPQPGVLLFQPADMTPMTCNHSRTQYEWSPGVELRLGLKYQLTRAAALRVGWNGLWLDGIARAPDLIDYTLSATSIMGLDMADNRQGVFMHGITFGIDINR